VTATIHINGKTKAACWKHGKAGPCRKCASEKVQRRENQRRVQALIEQANEYFATRKLA